MERELKKEHRMVGYLLPIVTALFFVFLCGIAVYRYHRASRVMGDQVIVQHMQQFKDIFKRIDEQCTILSFDHEKNYIDFLTVKNFEGSEIGAMNLAHPENWEGPYMEAKPVVNDKQYAIVKTKNGYYVVPGDGIQLSNGKVVGKDIIINKDTDMEALLKDPQGLT